MSETDYYEFPTCMHAMASAFHRAGICPSKARISLPFDEWWRLWHAIERKHRGFLTFDGRGANPAEFKYMGFVFSIERT